MKKIILFFIALISFVSMSAQTVESSRFFDNTYIGINTGVSAWLKPQSNGYENFGKSIQSVSSLRLGKMITPIFGVELEGEVGFANRSTFVDHTNVGVNFLWNLNNSFHPYKGLPDNVEVVPFVGLGWYHTYSNFGWYANDMSAKGGIQLNINVGSSKAWQINVIPSITWVLTGNAFNISDTEFNVHRAYVGLQVGATYKFKNSHGTHNFVLCPFKFTQKDIDELNAEINNQRCRLNECAVIVSDQECLIKNLQSEIETLKGREMVTHVEGFDICPVIGFNIGSSEIPHTQWANLWTMGDVLKAHPNMKVIINGFADADTGSAKRNMQLSNERANNVKAFLENLGVSSNQLIVIAKGAVTPQIFKENNLNRAVIFEIKN